MDLLADLENRRRSVAMLTPGQFALRREAAIDLFELVIVAARAVRDTAPAVYATLPPAPTVP